MTIRELTDQILRERGSAHIRRENVTGRKVQLEGYLSVWEENNFEVAGWHFEENGTLVIEF